MIRENWIKTFVSILTVLSVLTGFCLIISGIDSVNDNMKIFTNPGFEISETYTKDIADKINSEMTQKYNLVKYLSQDKRLKVASREVATIALNDIVNKFDGIEAIVISNLQGKFLNSNKLRSDGTEISEDGFVSWIPHSEDWFKKMKFEKETFDLVKSLVGVWVNPIKDVPFSMSHVIPSTRVQSFSTFIYNDDNEKKYMMNVYFNGNWVSDILKNMSPAYDSGSQKFLLALTDKNNKVLFFNVNRNSDIESPKDASDMLSWNDYEWKKSESELAENNVIKELGWKVKFMAYQVSFSTGMSFPFSLVIAFFIFMVVSITQLIRPGLFIRTQMPTIKTLYSNFKLKKRLKTIFSSLDAISSEIETQVDVYDKLENHQDTLAKQMVEIKELTPRDNELKDIRSSLDYIKNGMQTQLEDLNSLAVALEKNSEYDDQLVKDRKTQYEKIEQTLQRELEKLQSLGNKVHVLSLNAALEAPDRKDTSSVHTEINYFAYHLRESVQVLIKVYQEFLPQLFKDTNVDRDILFQQIQAFLMGLESARSDSARLKNETASTIQEIDQFDFNLQRHLSSVSSVSDSLWALDRALKESSQFVSDNSKNLKRDAEKVQAIQGKFEKIYDRFKKSA